MQQYTCKYPGCNYTTDQRRNIDKHHIIPKSLGGSNKECNLIELCANHHRQIFVPECISGIHSQRSTESIILINIYDTNQGKALHYKNAFTDIEYIYFYETGLNEEWYKWTSNA